MKTASSALLVGFSLLLLSSGCSSTSKRAGIATAVGGAGAAAGYALTQGKSSGTRAAATAGGALLGAGAAMLAMGEDEETYQVGYTDGYHQGQGESIKRQYWMQQNMSRHGSLPYGDLYEQTKAKEQPRVIYQSLPGPTTSEDGAILEPHSVTVPVLAPGVATPGK